MCVHGVFILGSTCSLGLISTLPLNRTHALNWSIVINHTSRIMIKIKRQEVHDKLEASESECFFSRAMPQSQNSEQTDLVLHCIDAVISIGSISVCSLTTNKLLNFKVTMLVEEWCLLTTLSKRWLGAGMVGRLVARTPRALALALCGPGLRPWLPRATNDLDTQGHQGTMVPGSTWPPPLGPEPSCSACALPVRGLATRATNLVHGEISWRSADPGYKQLAAN